MIASSNQGAPTLIALLSHTPLAGQAPASTGFRRITPRRHAGACRKPRARFMSVWAAALVVEMASGAVLTFQGVVDGALAVAGGAVRASGTTASGLIGLVWSAKYSEPRILPKR